MLICNNWHNTDSFLIIFALNKMGVWMRVQPWHLDVERERDGEKMQLPGVSESGARLWAITSFPSLSMNKKPHIRKMRSSMRLDVCRTHAETTTTIMNSFIAPESLSVSLKSVLPALPASHFLPGRAAPDGLSVLLRMSLYFLECHLWGITQYSCSHCLAFSLSAQSFQYGLCCCLY